MQPLEDGDWRGGNSCTGSEGNSERLEKSGLLAVPGSYALREPAVGTVPMPPLWPPCLVTEAALQRPCSAFTMQAPVSTTAAQSLCDDAASLRRPLLLFFLFLRPLFWMISVGCCC